MTDDTTNRNRDPTGNRDPAENRGLPPALAERFATVLDLDDPPATLDEWAEATADRLDAAGVSVGVDKLCTTTESRHEARIGDERWQFRCVLDALLTPFVLDDAEPVEVRSEGPASGEVVEIEAGTDHVSVAPTSAIVSLGLAVDVEPPGAVTETVTAYGHGTFCPYVNAFPDEAAYKEWDEATPEAVTMPVPVEAAHRLAQRFGDQLA